MKQKQKQRTIGQDMWRLLPVLIALCLIPFVVLTKDYQTEFSQFVWFNQSEIDQIDSFEYTKSICVFAMGIVAAVVLAFGEYANVKKRKPLFSGCDRKVCVMCAVFALMVIISSVFSKYSNLAFTGGGYGQWQTMQVLLSYVVLFLYAYSRVDNEKRLELLIKCMVVSTGLIALLGVCQVAGNNPLSWDWAQKIITSRSKVGGISFQEGVSNVILTFNNPNYVGPYVALVLPVIVAFVTTRASENRTAMWACRIAGVLVAVGLAVTLFGSSSSAGAISVVAGAVVFVVILLSGLLTRREKVPQAAGGRKKADAGASADTGKSEAGHSPKKYMVAGGVLVVIIVAGILVSRTAFFQNTVNKVLQGGTDTRNIAAIVNNENNELEVTLRNDEEFVLAPVEKAAGSVEFHAYGKDKKEIPLEYVQGNTNYYVLQDERFPMVTLEPVNFSVEGKTYTGFRFHDAPNQISWSFMCVDGQWKYYTPFGKFMKLEKVESFGFKNYQNIANRRGYIWSRTIPLMKDYWFKGVGPNAFIIAFPNTDFVGAKRVGDRSTLVDKPHNSFLQIYVQLGGIAAIAYAGLWIVYMYDSIRLFWRRRNYDNTGKIAFGLMIGIFSFAVAGITNDTVVGSQVIYWILLGVGFAANRIMRVNQENAQRAAEMSSSQKGQGPKGKPSPQKSQGSKGKKSPQKGQGLKGKKSPQKGQEPKGKPSPQKGQGPKGKKSSQKRGK